MAESNIVLGENAPAFTLCDQDGKTVALKEVQGQWIVLYFYPRDDTPGCTTQACDFTSGLEAFQKLNAVVLGCSPDSMESHQKFIEKHKLKITLLSDENHEVMRAYGAWGTKNMFGRVTEGVIRSTVLIDPAGKVAYHWSRVKAAGHVDKVREKLEELQTV
jgi:peroxiredoxin Q/BCP